MKNNSIKQRAGIWRFVTLALIFLVLGTLILLAWLKGGFVECTGYLEPGSWVPLYAPDDGIVKSGNLTDGSFIKKDTVVLRLEDDWPKWNIKRLEDEKENLQKEKEDISRRLALFKKYRNIEIKELERRLNTDRLLHESASITINDLKYSEYKLSSFIASSRREEARLIESLNVIDGDLKSLANEKNIWEKRLKDCELKASAEGTFYSAKSILAHGDTAFIPPVGPGQKLESGILLGYIIPGGRMTAKISIPQRKIARCKTGQQVLLSLASRPRWNYPPIKGRIVSIASLSSRGFFPAEVEILQEPEWKGKDAIEGLNRLSCGDLTARININSISAERLPGRIWQWWVVLVNVTPREKLKQHRNR